VTPEVLRSLITGAETVDVKFEGEEAHVLSGADLVSLSSASSKVPMPRGTRG